MSSGLLGIISFAAMLAFIDGFAPYVVTLFFVLFFVVACTTVRDTSAAESCYAATALPHALPYGVHATGAYI